MNRSILILAFLAFLTQVDAQSYRNATGIRFDSDNRLGITVQQKIYDQWTMEGLLLANTKTGAVNLTVLAEQHNKVLFKNLNVYVGAGVHKTWQKTDPELGYKAPSGIVGVAGVEFSLDRLNISWDMQPKMNIFGGDRFFVWNTGLSVRYIVWKQKKKKINWKFWKKR